MAFLIDPNCPVPEFIAAADLTMNRLVERYGGEKGNAVGICFFGEHFFHNGMPYDYARVCAFGNSTFLLETIAENLKHNRQALDMITKAWYINFLNATQEEQNDPHVRESRRILLRLLGKNEDGSPMTPADEARAMADQILREHPERQLALSIMKQQAKKYRQAGLNDMRIVMEQCMADLRLQMEQDERSIIQTNADADALRADNELSVMQNRLQLEEARRVKQMKIAEGIEYQQLMHDYEQALRRSATRREFVERMQADIARIDAENRQREQHHQFNVQSAVKARKQKAKQRRDARNAGKNNKGGSGPSSCSTLFG